MDHRKVEVHFNSLLIDYMYIFMNVRFVKCTRLIVSNILPRRREREREKRGAPGEVCRQLESLRMATTRDIGEPKRGSEGKKV